MTSNDYHFISHWCLRGSLDEVVAIMGDPGGLPQWWPSVYLSVRELAPGDERGIGKAFDLHTRGWLPYTLRWQLEVVELGNHTLTIKATGDFTGSGIWTAVEDGQFVRMTYDWKIRANKPILRYLSPLLKPIFAANHGWAMTQGERSLQRELERRRSPSGAEAVKPINSLISHWLMGLAVGALGTYLLRRIGTPRSLPFSFKGTQGTGTR